VSNVSTPSLSKLTYLHASPLVFDHALKQLPGVAVVLPRAVELEYAVTLRLN
jgi:hypothetical protein